MPKSSIISRAAAKRLLAEFVVIVIGILVALAVDDYRELRRDISTEAYLLSQLREDLDADLRELTGIIEDATYKEAAGAVIQSALGNDSQLAQIGPDAEGLRPGVTPARAVRIIGSTLDFDVTTRTFDQMNQTGSFQTIRDRELRELIVAYYSYIAGENLQVQQEIHRRSRFHDLLERNGLTSHDDVSDARFLAALQQDQELAALIRNITRDAVGLRDDFKRFERVAQRLVERIDQAASNDRGPRPN